MNKIPFFLLSKTFNSVGDKSKCLSLSVYQDKYLFNIATSTCINCNNPRKQPDEVLTVDLGNETKFEEGQMDAAEAV